MVLPYWCLGAVLSKPQSSLFVGGVQYWFFDNIVVFILSLFWHDIKEIEVVLGVDEQQQQQQHLSNTDLILKVGFWDQQQQLQQQQGCKNLSS